MQPGGVPALPERQHAPVAGGHVVAPHTEFGPRKRPPWATQAAAVEITQLPSDRQQAPFGLVVGHVLAVQVVPGPRHTPLCVAHSVWVSTWQVIPAAVGMQQAPVGVVLGQVLGPQVVPFPR